MSEIFFQSKNSNRSKQTNAKCNQIGNLGFGLGYKSKLFYHVKINETTLNFLAANILFFKKENVVVAQLLAIGHKLNLRIMNFSIQFFSILALRLSFKP